MANFGEFPLNITLDEETETYSVVPQQVTSAAAAGITATFPAERLEIMRARGAAFGYVLIEQSTPSTVKVG